MVLQVTMRVGGCVACGGFDVFGCVKIFESGQTI